MGDRFSELRSYIASLERVVVCFSGGLDSTVLMHVCKEELGDGAIPIYVSVPMETQRTVAMVRDISDHLGFDTVIRHMDDRISGIILQNTKERCYLCKKAIYSEAIDLAYDLGIGYVLCGDNADDDESDRPGMKAGKELSIQSPFRKFGIGRKDIESYIDGLALPFPMVKDTCLLTRIPIGTEADETLMESIERMESCIHDIAGIAQIRARVNGDTVGLQTSESELENLLAHLPEIDNVCKMEGFGTEVIRTGYKG